MQESSGSVPVLNAPAKCHLLALLAALLAISITQAEPLRIALMDFSTDDNSYPSIQAAIDFTGLVQASLVNEPDILWVERSNIHRVREELNLDDLMAEAMIPQIQRGRTLGFH